MNEKSLKASPNFNYTHHNVVTEGVGIFTSSEARGFFSCFLMRCVLHKIAMLKMEKEEDVQVYPY